MHFSSGGGPKMQSIASRRLPLAALLLALSMLAAPPPAAAHSVGDVARDAGLGLAAATCTVGYAPLKVVIAASGFVAGGIAFLVTGGDHRPAVSIMERTAGGDWVITQSHLVGDRNFAMLGPPHRRVAHR
jgi:hypothetical protein